MSNSVSECERDVELARAKLRKDLSTLRSPTTFSSFTDELKAEAFEAKDAVVEHAKETVRTSVEAFIDDVKARAAANPAAALAIGAGVAWQLLRHPPITSLLVGAGVLSLWRTTPRVAGHRDSTQYFEEGKQRLKEQVGELGVQVSKAAAEAGRVVGEKADRASEAAVSAAQDWSRDAARTLADLRSRATVNAREAVSAAEDAMSSTGDQARLLATEVATGARRLTRDAATTLKSTLQDDLLPSAPTRDTILLGVAGFAIAGALGIAFQKRVWAERTDVSAQG